MKIKNKQTKKSGSIKSPNKGNWKKKHSLQQVESWKDSEFLVLNIQKPHGKECFWKSFRSSLKNIQILLILCMTLKVISGHLKRWTFNIALWLDLINIFGLPSIIKENCVAWDICLTNVISQNQNLSLFLSRQKNNVGFTMIILSR